MKLRDYKNIKEQEKKLRKILKMPPEEMENLAIRVSEQYLLEAAIFLEQHLPEEVELLYLTEEDGTGQPQFKIEPRFSDPFELYRVGYYAYTAIKYGNTTYAFTMATIEKISSYEDCRQIIKAICKRGSSSLFDKMIEYNGVKYGYVINIVMNAVEIWYVGPVSEQRHATPHQNNGLKDSPGIRIIRN